MEFERYDSVIYKGTEYYIIATGDTGVLAVELKHTVTLPKSELTIAPWYLPYKKRSK